MSENKCEFCNTNFTTKNILYQHQKKAKFCLRLRKESNNELQTEINDVCIFCEETFKSKAYLNRHYESCKIRSNKLKEEQEELIHNLKNEINKHKQENLILNMKNEQYEKELRMKDEINQELKKEIETLKNKIDSTYMTLIDRTDKTYNTFFEKEEKLVDTLLLRQNISSQKDAKSITNNNNLTINNYGIKPLTTESVINAFESYNSKYKTAFCSGYIYNNGELSEKYHIEDVFYGIIRELKEYYGITDVSREKIIYNNNGEMTSTTVKDFIKTNIVMKNIDEILEWISNLKTQIFKRMEDGYIITNDGTVRDLTSYDMEQLKLKQDGLTIIYGMFQKSKEMNEVNGHLQKYMSEGAMKYGIAVEKKFNSLK